MTVDLEELIEAFEDASDELNYFVDLETGEIVLVSETLGFIEAGKQRFEMDLAPDRYLAVPVERCGMFEGDLDAFLDRVSDDDLATALENALDSDAPSNRVDALLAPHPEIAADWAAFRRERIRVRTVAWAREHRLATYSGTAAGNV